MEGSKKSSTHFHFLAECSIWAILELALVMNIVNYSRSNDVGLQAFLAGDIIKTEPPASAANKSIKTRSILFQKIECSKVVSESYLFLPHPLATLRGYLAVLASSVFSFYPLIHD